ncbi:MAG: sensor histidine kinase [Alphaproteobacteria bacterium]|nr:sensor histidine kinase [Alphaproteobacteria bacterium]
MSRARRPGSLRGRLVALVLIGAVPLAAMAGLVAWQDYRATLAQAEENLLLLDQSISARHRAAVEEVWQELGGIAHTPTVLGDFGVCDRLANDLLVLRSRRYLGVAVVDRDAQPHCRRFIDQEAAATLSGAPATSEWFRAVQRNNDFTVTAARHAGTGGDILLGAAYPIVEGQHFLGAAAAVLRLDWLPAVASGTGTPYLVWLIDPDGTVIPVSGALSTALPAQRELTALLRSAPAFAGRRAVSGRHFFYSVTALDGGLRLLVAQDAIASTAAPRAILLDRILGLGLLMILALAGGAFGVTLAFVRPLARLAAAVERWRTGGPFEAGAPARAPAELRGLYQAFSDAIASLSGRERQLREALEKQELLTQEIHHRVKNNLQVVASLLNLQASRIRQPAAKAEFQSARDRVQALATLHRHMYLQGELQAINMRSFLVELCGQLFRALGPASSDRIKLDVEASDLRISSDRVVPLALIVTETVGNAIKYAFPGDRRGRISVRLTATDDEIKLVVQDDGVGLPAVRTETETGVRDGIGLQLVRGLAQQLGARLTVGEDSGTRYEATMPLHPSEPEPGATSEPAIPANAAD